MDNLNFKFKAYQDEDKVVVHVVVDGAEAIFRYNDADSVALLAENMKYMIDYAIEDYVLNKKFKEQIDNDLQDWLSDGP